MIVQRERKARKKGLVPVGFVVFLVLALITVPVQADSVTFTWSGQPIEGEDPTFFPSGSAVFDITGSTLTITLTNTSSQTLTSIGLALSGLTWDITDSSVVLDPISALIASGSMLVGVGATGDTDLSGEWGFKNNISAGSGIGAFGISSVGDINLGADTFGIGDRFDTTTNLFGIENLNGIDAAIVGLNVDLTADGFTSQGPVVKNQMIFTFYISSGTLSSDEIENVLPMFGTDGAFTTVPEPSTLTLLGAGLIGLGMFRRFH